MPRYQRLAQIIRSGTSATRHLRGLPWATAWRTALFWARVKRSNPDTWLLDGRLLASAYPRREAALAALTARQVAVLVNLHARRHDPALLAKHGLREVHLPVRDFTPPAPEQIDQAVAAIDQALGAGERVAVHCGAGLGRTGTVIACYLVAQGHDPAAAIAEIRRQRPGSVETATQAAAVTAYAARLAQG